MIDDFIDSPYRQALWDYPAYLTAYQPGPNIIGGVRQTSFGVVQAMPLGQRTLLQIHDKGPLVVSGDYKSYLALMLGYGYDTAGGANRLNLDLTPYGSKCPSCDRFRINFDGCDSELSYLMQVYDSNGNVATRSGTESTSDRILPFYLDFPFAEFEQHGAQPIDWGQRWRLRTR